MKENALPLTRDENRRLISMPLLAAPHSQAAVSELVGVNERIARRWKEQLEECSYEGLLYKYGIG